MWKKPSLNSKTNWLQLFCILFIRRIFFVQTSHITLTNHIKVKIPIRIRKLSYMIETRWSLIIYLIFFCQVLALFCYIFYTSAHSAFVWQTDPKTDPNYCWNSSCKFSCMHCCALRELNYFLEVVQCLIQYSDGGSAVGYFNLCGIKIFTVWWHDITWSFWTIFIPVWGIFYSFEKIFYKVSSIL